MSLIATLVVLVSSAIAQDTVQSCERVVNVHRKSFRTMDSEPIEDDELTIHHYKVSAVCKCEDGPAEEMEMVSSLDMPGPGPRTCRGKLRYEPFDLRWSDVGTCYGVIELMDTFQDRSSMDISQSSVIYDGYYKPEEHQEWYQSDLDKGILLLSYYRVCDKISGDIIKKMTDGQAILNQAMDDYEARRNAHAASVVDL